MDSYTDNFNYGIPTQQDANIKMEYIKFQSRLKNQQSVILFHFSVHIVVLFNLNMTILIQDTLNYSNSSNL